MIDFPHKIVIFSTKLLSSSSLFYSPIPFSILYSLFLLPFLSPFPAQQCAFLLAVVSVGVFCQVILIHLYIVSLALIKWANARTNGLEQENVVQIDNNAEVMIYIGCTFSPGNTHKHAHCQFKSNQMDKCQDQWT